MSLIGVGCASDGTCWAAGTNRQQTAGVLVPISDGKPGSPKQISGTSQLTGVACETPTSCVAVGQQAGNPSSGVVVPITNGVPGSAEPVAGAYGLSGVACATSAGCVAVGGGSQQAGGNEEGVVVPISGLTPGAPRVLSAFLSDVACQDASHCFAVGESSTGGTAAVVAITDGQPGSAQTVGQPNPATSVELLGVACAPGTTSCLAVGQQLTPPSPTGPGRPAQGVAVPISNGTVGAVATVSSVAHFFRVACKSATSCLAAGSVTSGSSLGRLVPIDVGGSAGAAKSETPGLFGVACWSAASCVAVGGEEVFLIGSATPGRAVVTAAVANALAVTGRAGRIGAIVRAGGYRASTQVITLTESGFVRRYT